MKQRGFSLLELILVLVILLVISGAIFQVINLATQRSSTEQTRLDMFQEAREFMDQMSRDLRGAGYPNPRNFIAGALTQSPIANDSHAAVGLVKIGPGDLWFEGDLDGTGTVSVVQYHLDSSTSNNCPCLKRSQLAKVDGDPLTGQSSPVFQVEVQGVMNADVFSAAINGAPATLPEDFTDPAISTLDTIKVVLTLRAANIDPQTHQRPVTTLISSVKLNNCSQATTGTSQSCQ
jgi:prepilin-type N-terminal cleavage/methylation domain-containing protein